MKTNPEGKGRTIAYIAVAIVAGGAALYFAFRGNGAPGPSDTKAQQRAAEIQSASTETPAQPPELPVNQRAPRGARPAAK